MLLHAVGVVMQSQQAEGDRGKLTCCHGLNISFRICKSLELNPDICKSDLLPWPKTWSWCAQSSPESSSGHRGLAVPPLSRNGGRQALS